MAMVLLSELATDSKRWMAVAFWTTPETAAFPMNLAASFSILEGVGSFNFTR
ncbi:Uncharacterised protein [Chlamydia trachomatis]|nr:Uncharacterised protein [Chlamydia trachomatis]